MRLPGHWTKGRYSDSRGNYCGLGMVEHVIEDLPYDQRPDVWGSWSLMHDVAKQNGYPDGFASFNDRKETTLEQVIAVMKKAARKWDEKYGK